MKLTKSQNSGLKKVLKFIESKNDIFVLKGAAGTGKTTLCKNIIEQLEVNGTLKCILLAPTGRAARILSQKTNKDSSTIHKHIYIQSKLVEYDKSSLKETFNLRMNENDQNTLYIVDESSMISNIRTNLDNSGLFYGSGNLLKDLTDYVFNKSISKKKHKIMFIGDQAQLPPINCSNSPALDQKILTEYFNLSKNVKVVEHTLKEIVRQESINNIIEIADFLRKQIEKDKFEKFEISKQTKNCKELNYYDLENQFVSKYKIGHTNNPIMITHSNIASKYKNEWIRKKLFKHRCKHENCNDLYRCLNLKTLEKEESLIAVQNSYKYDILNGDTLTVKKIFSESEENIPVYEDKKDKKPIYLKFIDAIIYKYSYDENKLVEQKVKILINSLSSNKNSISKKESNALNAYAAGKYQHLYKKIKNKLRNKDTDPFMKAFFEDEHRNALHVKYGYSITCHKSQGGEWNDAYIDFSFSTTDKKAPLTKKYFRWSYTAITRAKNNIYHINSSKIKIITNNDNQKTINYK